MTRGLIPPQLKFHLLAYEIIFIVENFMKHGVQKDN